MTYTANNPQPGSVHRDGVAIAFTRGSAGEAEAEAVRIADALTLVGQIARMTLATETECGQCEGTGSTQSMSNLAEEPCPVCDGSGQIDGSDLEEGAGEALDALIAKAREIASGAPCYTPPEPPADEYLCSFDYELIADALDVLDPDNSEATNRKSELEAWARSMAATGRGYLPKPQLASEQLTETHGDPLRELAADVLSIDRDDDGDAMLDAAGLDTLQDKARAITA